LKGNLKLKCLNLLQSKPDSNESNCNFSLPQSTHHKQDNPAQPYAETPSRRPPMTVYLTVLLEHLIMPSSDNWALRLQFYAWHSHRFFWPFPKGPDLTIIPDNAAKNGATDLLFSWIL
jgi:hypothetical protein